MLTWIRVTVGREGAGGAEWRVVALGEAQPLVMGSDALWLWGSLLSLFWYRISARTLAPTSSGPIGVQHFPSQRCTHPHRAAA